MPTPVTNPFAVIDEIASTAARAEELFSSYYYVGSFAATASFPIFPAPFALQVKQAAIVVWNTTLAANDTNYWRLAVRRTRANASVEIVSKSTQLTGGEGITQRTDWNFDAAVWSATNGLIAKGDVIDLGVFMTGAPAALSGLAVTVRYEPV